MSEFKDMTKSDMLDMIIKYELSAELAKHGSDPKKINNDVILDILNTYKASKEPVESKVVSRTKGSKMDSIEFEAYIRTGIPVIVTDHDNTYKVHEDDNNRTVIIEWGNPVLGGMTTERIALNGLPQVVTRGALKVMRQMFIPRSTIHKETGRLVQGVPIQRFSISEVAGWTQEQLDVMKKEELGR
jgi:hypothetical protein